MTREEIDAMQEAYTATCAAYAAQHPEYAKAQDELRDACANLPQDASKAQDALETLAKLEEQYDKEAAMIATQPIVLTPAEMPCEVTVYLAIGETVAVQVDVAPPAAETGMTQEEADTQFTCPYNPTPEEIATVTQWEADYKAEQVAEADAAFDEHRASWATATNSRA